MTHSRHFVKVIGLVVAVGGVTPPTIATAQVVQLVLGTGVTPSDLTEGSRLTGGTVVRADPNTIVVLERSWRVATNQDCVDLVVLRGATYRVETATPKPCPEQGAGDEFARAMAGETMTGRLTVLAFDAPKADIPQPEALLRFQRDVAALRSKSPDPPQNRAAKLIQARARTSMCLHRKLNDWRNGNPIHLWSCSAGNASMKSWEYERSSGLIRSTANRNKCWHKQFNHWQNGNPIHLWDCNAGPMENKSWDYDAQTGRIQARGNRSLCIHKKENNWNNGNPVHLWACNAGSSEFKSWTLQ